MHPSPPKRGNPKKKNRSPPKKVEAPQKKNSTSSSSLNLKEVIYQSSTVAIAPSVAPWRHDAPAASPEVGWFCPQRWAPPIAQDMRDSYGPMVFRYRNMSWKHKKKKYAIVDEYDDILWKFWWWTQELVQKIGVEVYYRCIIYQIRVDYYSWTNQEGIRETESTWHMYHL